MERDIHTKNGNYKVIEIKQGHIYELKKQRKNGVFAKISRFNAKSIIDAYIYCIEKKVI